MADDMDDGAPEDTSKRRTVRYKITGSVLVREGTTVTQAMAHVSKVIALARTLGDADVKLSIPRLTDVQL